MTNETLLNGSIRPGHPLRLLETGEEVYFRSARYSPHADGVLAIVADVSGGVLAVSAEEIDHMHYDEDGCQCADCVPPSCERKYADGVCYHAGQE